MSKNNFLFEFNKFSLKSKTRFLLINLSESFIVAVIISRLFIMNTTDTLLTILIGLLMTPLGIKFVGGFEYIKSRFIKRHNLKDEDFI